jgi:mRNA interferase MazF
MRRKLNLTVDEEIYEGLRRVIGPRNIAKFVEVLIRPHVVRPILETAYGRLANDRREERPAHEPRPLSSPRSPVKRGEIWWVDFDGAMDGPVKGKHRAVVVSNDASNKFLSQLHVVPLTSPPESDSLYPCEAMVTVDGRKAKVMADQLARVGKSQLLDRTGTLSEEDMLRIKEAIRVQLDFY